MKRSLILVSSIAVLSAATYLGSRSAWSAPEATTYEGDGVHSFVLFKIRHLGASWVWGRFDTLTASVDATDAGISSVNFEVKTDSVDTGSAGRDKHLKSPDFFNAKQFPTITFKSTAVKAIDANTSEVTGDLTLHGVTKSVTATVTKVGSGKSPQGVEVVGYESLLTVKRSDYEMSGMIPMIGDDVALTIDVEGAKK
jgi:polyisoprenoid-binding protein YceI